MIDLCKIISSIVDDHRVVQIVSVS
jgi:hypothetical protein